MIETSLNPLRVLKNLRIFGTDVVPDTTRRSAQEWVIIKAKDASQDSKTLRNALAGETEDTLGAFFRRHAAFVPESVFQNHLCEPVNEFPPEEMFYSRFSCVLIPDASIRVELQKLLKEDGRVEYAVAPPIRDLLQTQAPRSADPLRTRQWGLQRVRFPQIWAHLEAAEHRTAVGVVDTGMAPHEDLPTPVRFEHFGLGPDDLRGHGTAVCGIVCAIRENGVGISGAIDCALSVYKVVDAKGWNWRAYSNALRRIATDHIEVVNLSVGLADHNKFEADMIAEASRRGVILVAGMGNEARRGDPLLFPAALPEVIAVGAIDSSDQRCRFSSTGDHIRLSAPGEAILTTGLNDKYVQMSGTSFATPFVTAAIAAAKSLQPELDGKAIMEQLEASADRPARLQAWNTSIGHGILNVEQLLSRVRAKL